MFTESAEYYDLIYNSFKDYEKEAGLIKETINKLCPHCKTILDVACGTGEHCKYLKDYYTVDGIDLNKEFLKIAEKKNPSGNYYYGDMTDFCLDKKYDAVLCLFSSIGYVLTLENVRKTLVCFKQHLTDKGIIIVEPWLTPDVWKTGNTHMVTVNKDNLKICRMNISERKGNISFFNFHYLIGTPEGVRHMTEYHQAGLFTVEEMKSAFGEARLEVDYDPEGIFGRGLYMAKKKKEV